MKKFIYWFNKYTYPKFLKEKEEKEDWLILKEEEDEYEPPSTKNSYMDYAD